MFASFGIRKTVFAVMVSLATCTGCRAAAKVPAPPPANDATLAQAPGQQTAVFAGGCFWGTQSVFERVKGVVATTAGYAGGSAATATYGQVTTETTGHAESVKVVYRRRGRVFVIGSSSEADDFHPWETDCHSGRRRARNPPRSTGRSRCISSCACLSASAFSSWRLS